MKEMEREKDRQLNALRQERKELLYASHRVLYVLLAYNYARRLNLSKIVNFTKQFDALQMQSAVCSEMLELIW